MDKKASRLRRARKGRARIRELGKVRLCVNRTPRHIYAQVIDESGDSVLAFELLPRRSLEMAVEHVEGCRDPLEVPSPWYVLMELATSSAIDNLRAKLGEEAGDMLIADDAQRRIRIPLVGIIKATRELEL